MKASIKQQLNSNIINEEHKKRIEKVVPRKSDLTSYHLSLFSQFVVRGLLGLLGPSAPRLVVMVNSQESESATILNQNMAGNLARELLLSSKIVWRKNAQVSPVLNYKLNYK